MGPRISYKEEIKELFNKLILMSRSVEDAIEKSIKALEYKDKALAMEDIEGDAKIDLLEAQIEQLSLKIMLLESPLVKDFRSVAATLKMITDLERIGDAAVDIAELSLQFKDEAFIKKLEDIPLLARLVMSMVKDSVQSYINQDLEMATGLDKRDDKVDELFRRVKSDLVVLIQKDSKNADQAFLLVMIAKYLERIGDHAVNIGEWTEFDITGIRKASKNKK